MEDPFGETPVAIKKEPGSVEEADASLDVETKLFCLVTSVLVLVTVPRTVLPIVCLFLTVSNWPNPNLLKSLNWLKFARPLLKFPTFIRLSLVVPVCCTCRSASCIDRVHLSNSGSNSTSPSNTGSS